MADPSRTLRWWVLALAATFVGIYGTAEYGVLWTLAVYALAVLAALVVVVVHKATQRFRSQS